MHSTFLIDKKIIDAGAIPIGILLDNNKIDYNVLKLCDGFIIPGGNRVYQHTLEIIYYAVKESKPLLGICLGAEALAIFSAVYEKTDYNRYCKIDELVNIYEQLKLENDGTLLKKLNNQNIHNNNIDRNKIDECRHQIKIDKNSLLYEIYKQDKIDVVSIHGFDFKYVGKDFWVSATASENVCEAIEFKDKNYFILGTHFHPEIEKDNLFFDRLVNECQKRSNIKEKI